VLSFDKPKKLRSTDEHAQMYSSDTNVDGTYAPNMSEKDKLKWKAKHIGGDDPRIEIRKTVSGVDPTLAKKYANRGYTWAGSCSAQVLVIVRKTGVVMSGNGRMVFDNKTWFELGQVVEEAQKLLQQGGNHGR
jgi:hypothetical protein